MASSTSRTSTPARARVDHRVDQHVGRFAGLEDVGLEVDRRLGACADGVAHGRIELRAVGEDLDAVVRRCMAAWQVDWMTCRKSSLSGRSGAVTW